MGFWSTPRPADDTDERRAPWRSGAEMTERNREHRIVLEAWDDELTKDELKPKPKVDVRLRREWRKGVALRIVNLVLFALAVIGAAAGLAVGWMHIVGDPLNDAHAYYDAASRLNAGGPLYPAGIDPTTNRIYLYPPLLATLLRPLALLPYEWFAFAWELIVLACFVWLVQHLGARSRNTWIAIGILGVPIAWALTVAQAQIPMTLLIAIGQPWSIAAATNLKLFPVLIALWWLGRREWESLAAFLMWSALFVLGQVLLAPDASFAFVRSLGSDLLGEPGVLRNISPYTISPVLWLGLLFVGCAAILVAARTRFGWAVAVTVATLAPPRLLVYMLTTLIAGIRQPRRAGQPEPDEVPDAALAYTRSFR